MLGELRKIPGADRFTLVSVQALHPFYSRGDESHRELDDAAGSRAGDRRQYRACSIASSKNLPGSASAALIFVGFSQGVAMAYRAALFGKRPSAGVIALGGDIPPDVKTVPATRWPRVLVGAGHEDLWYTAPKVDADEAFLRAHGVDVDVVRFAGGHAWTDEFRVAAGRWLSA